MNLLFTIIIYCRKNNVEELAISHLQQAGYKRHYPHVAENHAREAILEKLKQDFPGIDDALLQDILRGCVPNINFPLLPFEMENIEFIHVRYHLYAIIINSVNFNDYRARQELRQLGYRSLNVSGAASHSPQRQHSPAARPVSPQQTPSPAPQPQRELTAYEKSQC